MIHQSHLFVKVVESKPEFFSVDQNENTFMSNYSFPFKIII